MSAESPEASPTAPAVYETSNTPLVDISTIKTPAVCEELTSDGEAAHLAFLMRALYMAWGAVRTIDDVVKLSRVHLLIIQEARNSRDCVRALNSQKTVTTFLDSMDF